MFSTAFADNAKRQAAVKEAEAALAIAREIPFDFMVLHLGTPKATAPRGDNSRAAASRSAGGDLPRGGAAGRPGRRRK